MSDRVTLTLASAADAEPIARMSRDLIEVGLGWSWTGVRVLRQIRCADTLVVTARGQRRLLGFGIMHCLDEVAHLNLLAVARDRQREGIGRRLVEWLESSARVAGIFTVNLEVRANNRSARAFYRALGYRETALLIGYYGGREPAIRMSHDLRVVRLPEPGRRPAS